MTKKADNSAEPAGAKSARARQLAAARKDAATRYAKIAELIKQEVGLRRHYKHKSISGVAWPTHNIIVAPEGITRRQLYVLAHECGHVLLHSSPASATKPDHVKEHEAEVYAHRTFARYNIEVPEKSAKWARAYVGQWIMKDRKAGIPICPLAAAWALSTRNADAPLSAVDGHPKDDFSKVLDRNVGRALKVIEKSNAIEVSTSPTNVTLTFNEQPKLQPPNACGTCLYFEPSEYGIERLSLHKCKAHGDHAVTARQSAAMCNRGESWRPSYTALKTMHELARVDEPRKRGFWARLGEVIIERLRKS